MDILMPRKRVGPTCAILWSFLAAMSVSYSLGLWGVLSQWDQGEGEGSELNRMNTSKLRESFCGVKCSVT